MIKKQQVLDKLAEVLDPELGISIVDLGLVYGVWVESEKKVHVKMTMTTPACPLAGELVHSVEDKLTELGFDEASVVLVWDPPWSTEKMSERARAMLGAF